METNLPENLEVVRTLMQQIGRPTLAMLGAGPVVALPNGVQFGVKGCKEGNKLVITLEAFDAYTVTLWKVRGVDFREGRSFVLVYADKLHEVIEALTGLRTRL